MRLGQILLISILVGHRLVAQAQQADSIKVNNLNDVIILGYKTMNGIGHLLEEKDGFIYAGKKNEIIIVDSLDANKAINNTRQILGRIPGLNIVETESGGFTANGIATRGLNPIQSIEMNVRQNGYNISGDVYGYNETYYVPPMEAVQRIEMVRGASSLQFGSQFGGLVNYVIHDPSKRKPIEVITSQTIGSFGMYNSFNSIGGTINKTSYYGYLQYRYMDGYRPNSSQWQLSGFGKIQHKISERFNVGVEYSLLRNQLKMPGGLTDSLFNVSSKISTRTRNWLKSPWNIVAAYANFTPSSNTFFSLKSTYLFSQRALVWRNEDGGPQAIDNIDPATNAYAPREVGKEGMNNSTTEFRFSHRYHIGNLNSTLGGGVRYAYAWFNRKGGGEGSTNSDFDLSIAGKWGYDLNYTTTNIAPFLENIFYLNDVLSITPGVRLEYLKSTSNGYKEKDGVELPSNESRRRFFTLAGIGVEYKATSYTSFYANYTQAYRPMDYSQLTPFGVTSKIDPNLKDAKGFNSDVGYRGSVKNFFNFDLGGFYMAYNNRIGIVVKTDPITNMDYSYRSNVANSVHKGIESYMELNILKLLKPETKSGINIFNSFAYIDAKYTTGEFKGNRVEAAAKTINRVGLILSHRHFSSTFQVNSIGDAYGDASNVRSSDDPIAGYIPAYSVLDFSATMKFKNHSIKAGVNNLTNQSYFTRRTDEYPGPGIIPAVGRSFYLGFSSKF